MSGDGRLGSVRSRGEKPQMRFKAQLFNEAYMRFKASFYDELLLIYAES